MRCDEVEEYISALYDGETVPLEAAEHAACCAYCRELLKDYAEMGATVRSYGALLNAESVLERTWLTTSKDRTTLWKKGLETMRIPRIAFACLVLLLVVIGSRLAIVEVRAHEDGSVLLLKLTPAQGYSVSCDVSTSGTLHNHCGGLAQIEKSNLLYAVKALRKDGNRVLLSVRTQVSPLGPDSFGPDTENSLPETQIWFTPGQLLSLPNTGDLKLVLTGEWSDHIPVGSGSSIAMGSGSNNALLDPGPNEIRLTSPLLLKNNKIVGDAETLSADADQPGDGVSLFIPGEGCFLFSMTEVPGAVQAKVQLNRISFESEGQAYVIVAGMPITRSEAIWAHHEAGCKSSADSAHGVSLGAGPVSKPL
jgi:hypothetical protein